MQRAPAGNLMELKSGWGLRLLGFLLFGGIAFAALWSGFDETSEFPVEAAWLILAICVVSLAALFVQQQTARVSLRADGLELYGLRGRTWAIQWHQIGSVAFDPTQGAFPIGSAIRIYDRQGTLFVVRKSIGNVGELGRRVLDAHTRLALGELFLLLEHGDDIRFGDSLMINRDLMRAPDPQTNHLVDYALRDFRGAMVKSHALEITLAGKPVPVRIKLKELPNAHLLQPILTKARALGPKVETALPVDHDQLEKTDMG
jgi:hypothetical protein